MQKVVLVCFFTSNLIYFHVQKKEKNATNINFILLSVHTYFLVQICAEMLASKTEYGFASARLFSTIFSTFTLL